MGKDVPFSHMLSFYHRTHMISYLNFETLQFNFLNIIISFIVDADTWSYPPLNDAIDVAARVREALAKRGWIVG
jgi:hypothetical protein